MVADAIETAAWTKKHIRKSPCPKRVDALRDLMELSSEQVKIFNEDLEKHIRIHFEWERENARRDYHLQADSF